MASDVPGLLGAAAERLLRTKWTDANSLSQELYAIFSSQNAVIAPASIQQQQPAGATAPGITLGGYAPGDTAIQITRSDGGPALNIGPDGISFGSVPAVTPGTAPGSQDKPPQSSSFPCQIVSGGPGAVYQANIYPSGLAGKTKSVTVTQLFIDPDETIPAGTWTVAILIGSSYYMQVPVWAADLS